MGFLSDLKRNIGRGLRSDAGKFAVGAALGYPFLPAGAQAGIGKFLQSSMLKNMARRYGTSYLTNKALGRPHSHKGALSAALWSLPFQAFKNYGLTQDLGEKGMKGFREGTDTPWWKLMLGQGSEESVPAVMTDPLKMVNPKGPSDVFLDQVYKEGPWDDMEYVGGDPYRSIMDWIPAHETQAARGPDPELGFLDMFMKDKPIYGEGEGAEIFGFPLGGKGPITGYEKGFDPLSVAPEVMGFGASGFTPEEKWESAKKRTEAEQEHMNKLMLNPYYQQSMYGWPGWGLGANRGGIMQKLQGGGDFLEDLVAQEDPMMEDPLVAQEDPTGRTLEGILDEEEGIPAEILEGIVNQRDPLMQKIMEMIMNMVSSTLPEDAEMPLMGPSGMGEMGDYIGPMSEIGEEEQGDLGMMGGGTYAQEDVENFPADLFNNPFWQEFTHWLRMKDQGSPHGFKLSREDEIEWMKKLKMAEGNPHLNRALDETGLANGGDYRSYPAELSTEERLKELYARIKDPTSPNFTWDQGEKEKIKQEIFMLEMSNEMRRKRQPTGDLDGSQIDDFIDILPQYGAVADRLGMYHHRGKGLGTGIGEEGGSYNMGGDYTMGAHVMGPGTGTSDSINAKLSDGEFVMTANAVKNLGGGDRYAGARKMYQMMNSLDPNSARPGEEPEIV